VITALFIIGAAIFAAGIVLIAALLRWNLAVNFTATIRGKGCKKSAKTLPPGSPYIPRRGISAILRILRILRRENRPCVRYIGLRHMGFRPFSALAYVP
jgi:hypothetical protein